MTEIIDQTKTFRLIEERIAKTTNPRHLLMLNRLPHKSHQHHWKREFFSEAVRGKFGISPGRVRGNRPGSYLNQARPSRQR